MRLTGFGKAVVASLLLAIASFTSAPRTAHAFDGAAVVAAITAMQAALSSLLQSLFQSVIMDQLLGKGNTAIVEQIAADTVSTQQALQHHVSATVEALTRQSIEQINDTTRREFGALGHVRIGDRLVNIGSNAPSACRRTQDARTLTRGGEQVLQSQNEIETFAADYNKRFQSQTALSSAMLADRQRFGDSVFALDWLQDVSIPQDEASYERAKRSITYATYTTPLPPTPKATNAAGSDYAARLQQHREAVKLPQTVLARQLALRRPITGDARGRSYMQIVTDWGKQAAEDAINPAAMQVKTEAGIQRENALLLSSLVAMQAEAIKAQHDTNALLAVVASRALDERSKELKSQYTGTVVAE